MPYTPHTQKDIEKMLKTIGIDQVSDLFAQIPEEVRLQKWDFPKGLGESGTRRFINKIARNNKELIPMIGFGIYDHEIPSAVWALAGKAEFVTAYTPYQAEASQGMLQAIFEFQSMIAELTGMDVANASLYDGATALCEAMLMAVAEKKNRQIAVSLGVNPLYREVLKTYAKAVDIKIIDIPLVNGKTAWQEVDVAAYIMQQPNFLGYLDDTDGFNRVKGKAFGIVSIQPILGSVLRKPQEYGADIVCGEGQPLGIPISSGGPLLGFMATKKSLMRKMPGRIVGLTSDKENNDAFVLTLQAREQHIRREKASSNICTNQALNALAATIYLSLLGPMGLREVATGAINNAHYLVEKLKAIGVEVCDEQPFLMEFPVKVPVEKIPLLKAKLLDAGFTPPIDLGCYSTEYTGYLLLCTTEKRTVAEIDDFVAVWEGIW